jgi:hypothetical protein
VYIVYIRERYYFSLVCTFKAIKNFEVKVDALKGTPRFREFFELWMCYFHPIHIFIQCCHMVIVLDDYPCPFLGGCTIYYV